MDIKELINEVTTQTVVKLKKSRLIKDNRKSAFKKTEELLRNYNKYLAAVKVDPDNTMKTKTMIKIIDEALNAIGNDPYYSIIEMYYFERKTRSKIAEFYDVDDKTITRNKIRLVNEIKYIICSDRTIEEIFF